MPRRYPSYPYVETEPAGVDDAAIEEAIADLLAQNPQFSLSAGVPLDPLARALNVDIEYATPPHEIALDVPLHGRPVIWLAKNGQPKHDRIHAAIGIGHWVLQVPVTREAHPGCGIQALHQSARGAAGSEARRFALALLMPAPTFRSLWYEGRALAVAEGLKVPTQAVYERAVTLDLATAGSGSAEGTDEAARSAAL